MNQLRVILIVICFSPFLGLAQSKHVEARVQHRNLSIPVTVAYESTPKQHCAEPIKYKISSNGPSNQNIRLEWTITHVSCNSKEPEKKSIVFDIPKGKNNVAKVVDVRTMNLLDIINDASISVRTINFPNFYISGEREIWENEDVNLHVQSDGSNRPLEWIWAIGTRSNVIGHGPAVSRKLFSDTRFYVWAKDGEFISETKELVVQVRKRPDPPSHFTIEGNTNITDIQNTKLNVKCNTGFGGLRWIWKSNGKFVGEGGTMVFNPKNTTTYEVYAEYFFKRSPSRYVTVNVTRLPEAPNKFSIVGKAQVYDDEKSWLKVKDPDQTKGVRWIWRNQHTKEEQTGDSILISPVSNTTYTLQANLNGKVSGVKTFSVNVRQRAVKPTFKGDFTRCIDEPGANEISILSGKLGTESQRWNWYEGDCVKGKLIHSGSKIALSPNKTTTYYVHPNNSPEACNQFTIEVGQAPSLPEKIVADDITCRNMPLSLEAVGKKEGSTKWNWYTQSLSGGVVRLKGEGSVLWDTIHSPTVYLIRANNDYCQSAGELRVVVRVKDQSEVPYGIDQIPIARKRNKVDLKVVSSRLADGSQWVWYRNNCGGVPIGHGEEIKYRLRKNNTIYVRAEGVCDTTDCKALNFVHKKQRSRFWIINFGLSSNKKSDYSGLLTIGSNRVYLRAKAPTSLLKSENKDNTIYYGVELESNNTKVTNYPSNTNTYYMYNRETHSDCSAISGGFLLGGNKFKVYAGGGYAERSLYWGADILSYNTNYYLESVWAKNTFQSVSGPMLEAGVFIKLGHLNMMGGTSMIIGPSSKKYRDAHIGIGFNINRKSK